MSYVAERSTIAVNGANVELEAFPVEYAEVYGVPFSFIPCAGTTTTPRTGPEIKRVRALEERKECEITFPRLTGYRYELPAERLSAKFSEESRLALSTADVPTSVENAPIIGESSIHTLDDLKNRREQEVAFLLAKLVLERYFRDDEGSVKQWLFPQLLEISRSWLDECLTCKDNTFPQLLLLIAFAHSAAEKIYRAIVAADSGEKVLKPIFSPYDTLASTCHVDFNTTKGTYATKPDKCHVSHVVLDSDWEAKMAQSLEDMGEVAHYVKNQSLGFAIPYALNGEERNYYPDYLVRIKDGRDDYLNLIVEVTGEKKKDKEAKVATARTLWVPAVNNNGDYGRWAFLEVRDPWNAMNAIRNYIFQLHTDGAEPC